MTLADFDPTPSATFVALFVAVAWWDRSARRATAGAETQALAAMTAEVRVDRIERYA